MLISARPSDGLNGFRKACCFRVKRDLRSRLGRHNSACGNGAAKHGEREHGVKPLGHALIVAGRAASAAEGPLGSPIPPQHGKALCSHWAIKGDQHGIEQSMPAAGPYTGAHAGCRATGVMTEIGTCRRPAAVLAGPPRCGACVRIFGRQRMPVVHRRSSAGGRRAWRAEASAVAASTDHRSDDG